MNWRGEAVLFDLDGVLVDSIEASERVWLRWGERHGIERERLLATIHNGSAHDSVAALAPGLDARAESARLEDEQIEDTDGVVALPGAAELLHVLPTGRWTVVTACTRPLAEARLDAAGLQHPDVLVSFDDVDHGKPAPDGYVAGARLLGADPARCLVVENSPSGVASGVAAGATVLALLTTNTREELSAAALTAAHLGDPRLALELTDPAPAPPPSA